MKKLLIFTILFSVLLLNASSIYAITATDLDIGLEPVIPSLYDYREMHKAGYLYDLVKFFSIIFIGKIIVALIIFIIIKKLKESLKTLLGIIIANALVMPILYLIAYLFYDVQNDLWFYFIPLYFIIAIIIETLLIRLLNKKLLSIKSSFVISFLTTLILIIIALLGAYIFR